jgi:hypothetical protein
MRLGVESPGGSGTPGFSDERVRWSIDLPPADHGHVLAAPDGRVVVSTRRFLAVVHPSGRPGWLVETDLGLLTEPVLLAGDRVLREEDGNLVTRDLATGAIAVSIAVPGVSGMTAGPDGDLLHSAWIPDRGPMLCRSAPDGPVRWVVPLTEPFVTLCRVGDRVLVADGGAVRGYDLTGVELWAAGRDGFRARDVPVSRGGQVHGPLQALPDGRVLVEFSESAGHGFYLLDPAVGTVRRVEAPVGLRRPMAVLPGGGPARLVAAGPTSEAGAGAVHVVDDSGHLLWSHELPTSPQALMTPGEGRVLAVCSPALDRWTDYHHWYDLSGECLVRCLGAAGEQMWTWCAPVPLTYRPAIGPDGTGYVAGPGRLWALRSQ